MINYSNLLLHYLTKLVIWTSPVTSESQILCLGHNNPLQCCRLGGKWLENCPSEWDLGVLVNKWLKHELAAQVAKTANNILV